MHQNLAVILRQLCYGKISFAVFVPGLSSTSTGAETVNRRASFTKLRTRITSNGISPLPIIIKCWWQLVVRFKDALPFDPELNFCTVSWDQYYKTYFYSGVTAS